ncbi:hypothetical protein RJ639_041045 [Escallonia herrerae]|uniref:Protein kinase domain-containing protein n=1 Tax=Escallonia herrerae TaxID=1293975 RepID=A0AA88WEC0_9ASTE|nr:hypothetical protein RJ639_041045 [Escallonia herrerae]
MEWTRGDTIGRGASATVSLATTASGDRLAVKSAELAKSASLQGEQFFLSKLSSPYVVEYMGFDVGYENMKPVYNLFMEYVPGGTLSDVIKKRGGSIDEPTIKSYTRQILRGLDYLQMNGLVHCDIKGQNILIGEDGARIADLGCAKFLEGGEAATTMFSGTPVFMAPEVARGEEQGFPADVWALGCTIIEMATGSHPWPDLDDPVSAIYRIGHSGVLPEFPRWLSDDGKDFLGKCFRRNAEERWTVKQLLEHPFLDVLDSGSGPKQVEELTRKSPTSVLDQGFWDTLEVSDPSPDPTDNSSSFSSPAVRIRNLIGGTSLPDPNLAGWAEEEDWVSVRSNHTEESKKVAEPSVEVHPGETQLAPIEPFLLTSLYEEEVQSSDANEYLLIECYVSEISRETNVRTASVLPCNSSVDNNVLLITILDFEDIVSKFICFIWHDFSSICVSHCSIVLSWDKIRYLIHLANTLPEGNITGRRS